MVSEPEGLQAQTCWSTSPPVPARAMTDAAELPQASPHYSLKQTEDAMVLEI